MTCLVMGMGVMVILMAVVLWIMMTRYSRAVSAGVIAEKYGGDDAVQ